MLSCELIYWWADVVVTLQKPFPNELVSKYLSLNSRRIPISSAIGAAQAAVAVKQHGARGSS
jgi:hypothetical protein